MYTKETYLHSIFFVGDLADASLYPSIGPFPQDLILQFIYIWNQNKRSINKLLKQFWNNLAIQK